MDEESSIIHKVHTTANSIPPLQHLVVSRNGTFVYNFFPNNPVNEKNVKVADLGIATLAIWAPDGEYLAVVPESDDRRVHIINTSSFAIQSSHEAGMDIVKLYFSPLSRYLLILSRYTTNNSNNLKLISILENKVEYVCTQKLIGKMNWPPIKWTSRETFCIRMVGNQLEVFLNNCSRDVRPYKTLHFDELSTFDISPETPEGKTYVVLHGSEKNRHFSFVKIYDMNDYELKVSKGINEAGDITFLWSYNGIYLLVLQSNDIDITGRSYYGSNQLLLFKCDGTFNQVLLTADQGPIHDCKWSSNELKFLVIKGPMPAEIILYDANTGNGILSFGKLMRNTIRWNPFGNVFLIGGCGALAGNFDIVDKNKKKVVGVTKIELVVDCEFAPDGQYFLTATTTPRLRVDNGIKFFKYNGDLVATMDVETLYSCCWKPVKGNVYKSQPTKALKKEPCHNKSSTMESMNLLVTKDLQHRQWTSGSLASIMRQERQANEIVKITSLSQENKKSARQVLPPGFAPCMLSKSSARRRKKAKEKGNVKMEVDKERTIQIAEHTREQSNLTIKGANGNNVEVSNVEIMEDLNAKLENVRLESDNERLVLKSSDKRMRNQLKSLRKKMADIEILKTKEQLNEEQKAKVALEDQIKLKIDKILLLKEGQRADI